LRGRYSKPRLRHLRHLVIDEFAVQKGHRYMTVVMDFETGQVVYVAEGRKAASLDPFWKRLKASRAKIQAVAIDMSPAYIAAVTRHLPKARLVFDWFHIVKMINDGIDKLRREMYKEEQLAGTRKVIRGTRWLLLKRGYHLDTGKNEEARLEEALKMNKPKNINNKLQPIRKIEFIELYEHVAQNAYYSLKNIENQEQRHLRIRVKPGIEKKYGGIRKMILGQDNTWWHDFRTEIDQSKKNKTTKHFKFQSSSGISRVEAENKFTSVAIVENLLRELSREPSWSPLYSKTLFEILIPNTFKAIIRAQSNILWKLDSETAAYPWEMFHDADIEKNPTFVSAGLIRQLATETYRPNPQVIRSNTALVVGDPIYEGTSLPQLPAAKREAQQVADKLKREKFEVLSLIGKRGLDIIPPVISGDYKILHIAGHGVFDPEADEIGVVLGNGMFLSPALYESRSKVPEFAFINCCFSGVMERAYERFYQDRYKLAANLGTQLIGMGVNAVVVTGWGVDDNAAELFASTLYDHLLAGDEFGQAVVSARRACYDAYPHTNTWGAYQCYGDPWYRLVRGSAAPKIPVEYIAEEQVLIDLLNLEQSLQSHTMGEVQDIIDQLEDIMQRAREKNLDGGMVREKEAEIYAKLDQLDLAIERYQNLLAINNATYSVKALEQYCNLRAKRIGRKGKATRAELRKMEKDLEALAFIGTTAERLSILGSASKRFAQISTGNQRDKYLQQMSDHYGKAWYLLKDKIKASIYPLSNWMTAHVLMHGNKPVILHGESIEPEHLLNNAEKELKKESGAHNDFWEDLNEVNIMMCWLLFCDTGEIVYLTSKIIDLYRHAWQQGGTYKHAHTEIEHIEFIDAIWKGKKTKLITERLKGLKEVRDVLMGWL
jgi:CHAT domain-containing protein